MEPRPELEERGDPPLGHHPAVGGPEDAADDLQQGGLPGPVGPHEPPGLPLGHLEPHVPEGPEVLSTGAPEAEQALLHARGTLVEQAELLRDPLDGDGRLGQPTAPRRSRRTAGRTAATRSTAAPTRRRPPPGAALRTTSAQAPAATRGRRGTHRRRSPAGKPG